MHPGAGNSRGTVSAYDVREQCASASAKMNETNLDRLRPVSSRQNALVKELRAAFQRGEATPDGHCAFEGVRLLEEAIRSSLRIKAVFFAESARERANRLLPQISNHAETLILPDEVFKSAVSTEAPQGVAALAKIHEHSLEAMLQTDTPLVVVASGLQDPGNLGTVMRSAEAFGASGLVTGDGTVNPYNPKVIRASAGSAFRLAIVRGKIGEIVTQLRSRGLRILATSSHKSIPLNEANLTGPLTIIIGNEGAGISRELLAEADQVIRVPHSSKVESLNAGIAASVVLYECSRQRNREL